jgi:hypothetical protein
MPFSIPKFSQVPKVVSTLPRAAADSVKATNTKIPPNVFNRLPIIGTSIKDLAMRPVSDKFPSEVTFLLSDLFRAAGKNPEHLQPTIDPKAKPDPGLESFMALLRQRNVVRSNRFYVEFFPPPVMQAPPTYVDDLLGELIMIPSSMNTQPRELSLLCHEASIPGKTIQTRQAMFNALPEQRAHMVDFGGESITFQFYLDGDWEAKRFFDLWQMFIIDPKTRQVGFYDNYKSTVTITNLDMSGDKTLVTTLEEAFPRAVQSINLSYSNPNIASLTVTMAFKRWSTEVKNIRAINRTNIMKAVQQDINLKRSISLPKINTVISALNKNLRR